MTYTPQRYRLPAIVALEPSASLTLERRARQSVLVRMLVREVLYEVHDMRT